MRRRLVTVLTALVLAAAGTFAVLIYVRNADERALAGRRAVQVLVAAKAIPAGTPGARLNPEGWIRTVPMPAETVPDDVLTGIAGESADLVTGTALRAGELLRRPLLVPRGQQSAGFAVPDGKIAVTVALSDPQRVAGHLIAGSKIAVFAVYPSRHGRQGADTKAARVLLPYIQVLSVGTADPSEAADKAEAKTLVTVAVTQREAEKLILGAQGQLHLGLLSDGSAIDENSPGVDGATIFR